METRPYNLQSPEQIAKDYGGNKQKIAEAMQMGILDPTAGTMAGMFIDRMRSAAQMEAAPQQTVAEQVFAPPAPPQPPMGASAGLGATPEAAAMPPMDAAPPQEMPPQGEMPMMAEGGMVPPYASGGGLSDMPLPDGMFDEPSNGGFSDGYAGGGLVAFAAGDMVDDVEETDGQRFERLVTELIPGTSVTSRRRSAADNARVGGARNSFHMTDQARDFVPPRGMSLTEFGGKLKKLLGEGTDVVYNSKGHFDHVHVEPGKRQAANRSAPTRDFTDIAASMVSAAPAATPTGLAAAALPNEDMSAMREQMAMLTKSRADDLAETKKDRRQDAMMALGRFGLKMLQPPSMSMARGGEVQSYAAAGAVAQPSGFMMPAIKDPMDAYKPEYLKTLQSSISGLMPQSNKYADLMMEDIERRRNPETMQKDVKRARNDAMMNFGFALMASKNPSFLGGFGEAGIPAAAALKADLKDLKKDARDALVEGAQAEGLKNTAARDLANLTLQNANIAATLQSGNLDREQRVQLEKLQRENALRIAEINENGANYRARLQETGANTRAELQATATLGTEARQTARIYRDQAEAARDRAMTLNRDFAKETNRKTKAALADQILAELRNYHNYNTQLTGMGGQGVNLERAAFRTLNTWAADKANNYTPPYAKAKTGGSSDVQKQADAILANQN